MELISIILFIIGFWAFFSNYKYLTLIVIALLSSNYLQLADPNFFLGGISLQHGDLALLLIFASLPFRKKNKDSQLNDIRKILFVFLVFLAVAIAYDFFTRGTTAMQIFRTTRKTGYLAFFFLINSFSLHDYQKFIYFFIILTLFHSILYISQYLFNYSFSDAETFDTEFGAARYRNIPYYIIPFFVIILFTTSKRIIKISFSFLLFIVIILAQSRGAITATIIVLLLFFMFQYRIKLSTLGYVFLFFIISYILVPYFFPIIGIRFQSLLSELDLVGRFDFNNLNFFYHQGSFTFRLGLTYERLMYVLADTTRIILGVGFIPDFDILNPIFILGTISPTLPAGYEQFNSADILFPNLITRYGIVGSLIFLYFIIQLFIYSYKNKGLIWGKILFTYLFALSIISLNSETFYNGQNFIIIFIMIGLIIKTKRLKLTA